MGEETEIGLEVAPGNGPEIIPQPDANKYFIKAERPKNFASDTFLHSSPPDARSREVRKLFFLLALFAILSLAIAVGAGLAIGLAGRHKSAPSSGPTAVMPVDSSAAIKTTNLAKVITMTATPSTTPGIPRFPKSLRAAGVVGRLRLNARGMRCHLNAQSGQPWDNPLFEVEHKAIKKWEVRYGVQFVPGTGMAEYDSGPEGAIEEPL